MYKNNLIKRDSKQNQVLLLDQNIDQKKLQNSTSFFGLEQNNPILAQNVEIAMPQTVLIQENLKAVYYQNSKDWDFEQLSKFYKKSNTICLSWRLGINYIFSDYEKLREKNGFKYLGKYQQEKANKILCNKFTCDRCRPKLKKRLKREIEKAIREHNLNTHIVITTEGKKYRDNNNYIQSYKDMAINWHKIQKIIKYELEIDGEKFTFICLYRAQKNGYCHLHILTNLNIEKQRLQEITSKYFSTGFIKITKNKNVANYLANEFSKDHEFYIPFRQKHYSCSRDIELNINDDDLEEPIEEGNFNSKFIHNIKLPESSMHLHLNPNRAPIDQIYEQIRHEYGYPPPFEIMLIEFYEMVHKT